MEEALHDVPLYREFAGPGDGVSRLPDETTILRFRHLLEAHDLAADMLRVADGDGSVRKYTTSGVRAPGERRVL